MSQYVVDAGVAAKWFLPEVHSTAALRLRRATYHLHVPRLFLLEFGNIVCKKTRRGELTPDEGRGMIAGLRALPLRYHANELLFPKALALAFQTQHSLYDCLYVALAVQVGGAMATADRKLYDALRDTEHAPHLVWIEDLPQVEEE